MKNLTAYVSFNRAPSSPPSNQRNIYFTPGYGDEDTDDTDDLDIQAENNSSKWWKYFFGKSQERAESGYLTLIPLSDSRLRPQRTRSLLVALFLVTFLSILGVFFLVPRGVTVGTIQVHSSRMSFNTDRSTYVIVLTATLPIYNLNYLSVLVTGTVNISFYDQQAGFATLSPTSIPSRTFPQVVPVDIDASSVPQKYLFTIYSQCFTFPDELIFFLRGNLQATYMRYKYNLPVIDNYFIVNCTANKPVEWEEELGKLKARLAIGGPAEGATASSAGLGNDRRGEMGIASSVIRSPTNIGGAANRSYSSLPSQGSSGEKLSKRGSGEKEGGGGSGAVAGGGVSAEKGRAKKEKGEREKEKAGVDSALAASPSLPGDEGFPGKAPVNFNPPKNQLRKVGKGYDGSIGEGGRGTAEGDVLPKGSVADGETSTAAAAPA